MKTYDLGWGESVAVRDAFLKTKNKTIIFGKNDLRDLGYPVHEGSPTLVELTKKIIKRQFGREYNHIFITNGATGGVTIALRSFAQSVAKACVTRDAPYFRLYPSMIQAAGLFHIPQSLLPNYEHKYQVVHLVDSLSNPTCEFSAQKKNIYNDPIIWDAVYYGNVYAPGNHPQPDHDVLVGSYSKLTGLNGLRTGWIALNDETGYRRLKSLVTAEYCGISVASEKIIMETAGQFNDEDWAYFEQLAQHYLDHNREEFSKLEKYFGGVPVPKYGMFYYTPIDKVCKKLLEKSGIIWLSGSQLGTNDDFGRFNVGQDIFLVKEAVQTVLKNDKR